MITTSSSFSPIERFVDQVLNDVMGAPVGGSLAARSFAPPVDILTSESEVRLCWDVPGLKQQDLELSIENGVLTVKGDRKYDGNANERAWLGRRYGAFSASYELPDYADTENVVAELADGVLSVRIPKQERARPKRISISVTGTEARKQLEDSKH
ncbi:MAG TPA: Hsp20/alpha crystallin family protein [Polyangiaceae bacterium]|nr:Hsp20/alpha crystallin family protein [Polyangiaceae bacterium]